jgi:ABC-type branched-subunit amino acid transport system ATPase component
MLEVAGVSKRFGGLAALSDVSLRIPPGRITAIIGPNGAGKTTLFAVIAGFTTPDAGSIVLQGEDITREAPHRRALRGLVRTFQIVQPFANLSVRENIAVGAHLFARSRRRALADAETIAARVGMGELIDRPASTLTIAGRKRLELARALATRPQLMLLDEVMAGLNPTEIGEMVAVVRGIRDRGVTLLLTEHVMAAVMQLAEHVLVLNDGRIIAQGAPAAVVQDAAVVEAYLGRAGDAKSMEPAPSQASESGDAMPLAPPSRPLAGRVDAPLARRGGGDKLAPSVDNSLAPSVDSPPTPARSQAGEPTLPANGREGGGEAPLCPATSTSETSSALLHVDNLHAGYGAMPVLRGVDLTVSPGEIVAVLGSNGAGKTTLNRALSGLIPAAQGRIRFAGADMTGADPAAIVAAGLVQVPEGRRIFPNLSVHENLALGSYRRGRRHRRDNFDRVLATFPRLAERRGQMAGTLSGGEQQMLAIGRGLMAEPQLLILDEPSLGLSPRLVEEMFALIAGLRRQGLAILLVEQNVMQTLTIADRASVLEHGAFALTGPAAELLAAPQLRQTYLGL